MQKNKCLYSPFKKFSATLINKLRFTRSFGMKNRVVKAKNLIAFRIWLEKLGYSVKNLADGHGFTFSFQKEYGLVTCELSGNALAMKLGEEFEDHLKA